MPNNIVERLFSVATKAHKNPLSIETIKLRTRLKKSNVVSATKLVLLNIAFSKASS